MFTDEQRVILLAILIVFFVGFFFLQQRDYSWNGLRSALLKTALVAVWALTFYLIFS